MASTIAAGTTSGTAIAIAGDTSGVLQLQTNGTTAAVTINTSQNVGIGTASPAQKLHVASSSSTYIQVQNTGNSVNAYYGVDTAGGWMGTSTNHYAAFYTNNTERMRINSSGQVTMPYQPFFYAKLTTSQTGFNATSDSALVIYDTTVTNTGNHYNTANGQFTAPVTGTYAFFAGAYSAATSFSQSWIVINGARGDGVDWNTNTGGNFTIGHWILKLSANDTIGFHPYSNIATNATINTNVQHTFFRGCLIS
jgi:hypothetical protein